MRKSNADIAGFILAGGESSRMGRDKALLELAGELMIVRTAHLLKSAIGPPIVVGSPQLYRPLGFDAVRDDWPGAGPLGAIATALRVSEVPWNLIVACDLPYLTKDWLAFLVARARKSQADVVLPMSPAGAEPLCAMYNKSCEAAISLALDRGVRKITDGLAHLRVEYLEPSEWKVFDCDGLLFKNMNSVQDYEEAKAKLSAAKT
jgi:molybdopterin-guanine dinucleotide biosynthesis protein A